MSVTTDNTEERVDELEREVEESRAEVSQTLDQLQNQVSETLDDWRGRLTAEQISKELKNYARESSRRFVSNMGHSIRNRVRDNPASAVAVGAAAAWPLFKLARKVPLSVYVIGAGVALMRPLTSSSDGQERLERRDNWRSTHPDPYAYRGAAVREDRGTVERVKDAVSDGAEQVAKAAGRAGGAISSAVAHAASEAGEAAEHAWESASDLASSFPRASRRSTPRTAYGEPHSARGFSPWVLGSLGVAVGAVIAAATHRTGSAGSGAPGNLRSRESFDDDSAARIDGARAAITRAYQTARREAEAQGMSPEDAETVARAFVLRMRSPQGQPSAHATHWEPVIEQADLMNAEGGVDQFATDDPNTGDESAGATSRRTKTAGSSEGNKASAGRKPPRRKKPG